MSTPDAQDTAGAALNRLGMLARYAGDLPRAREAYAKAMELAVARFGEESDAAATVWHNLAGLHHSAGDPLEAVAAARRAVSIRSRLHGDAHPDVVADLGVLAAALQALENLDACESIYLDALAFWHERGEHFEVAVILNNLADVYRVTGRRAEAEAALRLSLTIKEAILGEGHASLDLTRSNLATLLGDWR